MSAPRLTPREADLLHRLVAGKYYLSGAGSPAERAGRKATVRALVAHGWAENCPAPKLYRATEAGAEALSAYRKHAQTSLDEARKKFWAAHKGQPATQTTNQGEVHVVS